MATTEQQGAVVPQPTPPNPPSRTRRAGTLLTLVLCTLGAILLAAGPASAHVTVNAPGATQGGYSVLTFRVPTESDTASTTALTVQLPTDQPLASVSVLPVPGWSYTVRKTKLSTPITTDDGPVTEAVGEIRWTADSAASAVKPGEFQQFLISVGPLPRADTMTFKALQTYSDKSVVSWIEQAAPGSNAEPEHPAPTLKLTAAAASDTPAGSDSATTATRSSSDDGSGRATAGLVLGVVGVLLGGAALALVLLRGRRVV